MTTTLQKGPGFSKSLKRSLIPASATILHPRTGDVISITAGFRRMTNGELQALRSAEADREALRERALSEDATDDERNAAAARSAMTDDIILDTLAPLFGSKDGVVEIDGIDDFPGPETGTPEQRFRRYFGGDGTEDDEELEVERLILRVLYGGYLQVFFRFTPLELVNLASQVSLRGGGAAAVSEAARG